MAKIKDNLEYTDIFECTEAVPLRPEDWEHLSSKSLQLRKDRDNYENQKTYIAGLMKGVQSELDEVTQIIALKKIYKGIKARYAMDYSTNEKKLYQVLDTGEMVYLRSEKMTDGDRQLKLRPEEEENVEA